MCSSGGVWIFKVHVDGQARQTRERSAEREEKPEVAATILTQPPPHLHALDLTTSRYTHKAPHSVRYSSSRHLPGCHPPTPRNQTSRRTRASCTTSPARRRRRPPAPGQAETQRNTGWTDVPMKCDATRWPWTTRLAVPLRCAVLLSTPLRCTGTGLISTAIVLSIPRPDRPFKPRRGAALSRRPIVDLDNRKGGDVGLRFMRPHALLLT
ncbi:uncharacterized protein J3D65DRAFT_446541 [Phyllosticta citribraziliensis]|uniref:Uncharacterized protein n=1 Tax=Phyllosticta citribraziliensis TaxID=989973 RepID=A0ABR1LJA1_9PEZI